VVRSRRQVWTVPAANGGGEVDVALGVNGYIWLSKHVEEREDGQTEGRKAGISISNLDEAVSSSIYSSQNDEIAMPTRREIARLAGCIKILAQEGPKVDEETVMKAYDAGLDADVDMVDEEEAGGGTLSADAVLRKKIVAAVLR
jgi:exosome complex component RRP4